MKLASLIIFVIFFTINALSQDKASNKKFDQIALVNQIDFLDSKFDQPRFSCGFLLKYNQDTFAITAKHLLKFIKSDEMHAVSFDNGIKNWSLFSLTNPNEKVRVAKLLNEDKTAKLSKKSTFDDDWLMFSIRENKSKVKALEIRMTPLVAGEKLYVVGWTRKMESGEQRVYEFEYQKTIGNRILLKDLLVPEQFGGLSGAPVIDENEFVIGIVSGKTEDPSSGKSYFSPYLLTSIIPFLDKIKKTN